MITREILEAQLSQYRKGREQAVASVSAFNGAIEAIENLLRLISEIETAAAQAEAQAAADEPKEALDV